MNFTAGTPSRRSPTKSTPGTARSTVTVKSTGGKKRKTPVKLEPSESEASEEVDYKARDLTPTPAPRPAKRAKNTAVDLTSESDESASTPADINSSVTSSLVTEESKIIPAQSQSFYEDSFVSGVGMNDVLLNADAMESFYPIGEI